MSQPTRARTTGGATRTARKQPAVPVTDAPATDDGPAAGALAPESLARTLRAVAAELERDPALARRVADAIAAEVPSALADTAAASPEPATEQPKRGVNRSFRPKLVTGASAELGAGIADPFALYAKKGEAGLRAALGDLRLGSLRAIIREHGLDPAGKVVKLNDAEKLREAIIKATVQRGMRKR